MRIVIVTACFMLKAAFVSATLYSVNPDGSGDYPTIQSAVDACVQGDTVLLADGVYLGAGNRDIGFNGLDIVLRSASDDPDACVIDAQGNQLEPHRAFHFLDHETNNAILQGVTIMAGWSEAPPGITPGGGIWCEQSSPTIHNCIFRNNHAGWAGGGLNSTSSSPRISDCTFVGNEAFREGGGLACNGTGTPRITDCRFIGNLADLGGGIYAHVQSTPEIAGCEFIGNWSSDAGGGIYFRGSPAPMTISKCLFAENDGEDGGGCAIYGGYPITLEHCTFVANRAAYWRSIGEVGAAICSYGTSVHATNCIIAFSSAGEATYGSVSIECCDVFGNTDGPGSVGGQIGQNGNFAADPLFCDAAGGEFTLHSDSPCLPENNQCGVLIGAFGEGCIITATQDGPNSIATLSANYPNPFNPETTISFDLSSGITVRLAIYDLSGRCVRTLIPGDYHRAGRHEITWNGMSDAGLRVPSGFYLYRLETANHIDTRKMCLLK